MLDTGDAKTTSGSFPGTRLILKQTFICLSLGACHPEEFLHSSKPKIMGSERTKLNGRTCYAPLQFWPYLVGVALKELELELEGYGANPSGSCIRSVAIVNNAKPKSKSPHASPGPNSRRSYWRFFA